MTHVSEFSEAAKAAKVLFSALTYQELIVRMSKSLGSEHREYVDYLSARYL